MDIWRDTLLIAPVVTLFAIVRIALYIFVPLYIWKIWKKVQHLPG